MANLEDKIPNTPQTKFHLASITKQFTATAILMLQERGKLNVQDPVWQAVTDAATELTGAHFGSFFLPVTSHLAVPVASRSGEVIGGLFFGHPEPGVFTGRHERLVMGLAAQAAVAMDNARLFEGARRARAEAEGAAAEKERLYRAAEEANRLKDEFLATVSHELRTPLTAILGWAHMLRTGQFDGDSAAKAFETIERNARAQSQLIDDLLDVSRAITGKLRIDVRPVDPNSFIEATVEAVRPAAEAKGGRVQVRLERVNTRRDRRLGHGRRHRARLPAARLRPLPPGRPEDDAPPRRPRLGIGGRGHRRNKGVAARRAHQ